MTTNFIMPVPLEHTCSLLQLCSWNVLYDRFLFIIPIVVRVVVNIILHCTCISLKSVEQTVCEVRIDSDEGSDTAAETSAFI